MTALARVAVLAAATALAAPQALSAQRATANAPPSITIYNDGRVLVRRTVPAQVARGLSTHRLALGDLDLATLFSLDSTVAIVGASYDGATDEASVLRRAVGRTLAFRYGGSKDTVSATVLGVDPLRLRMADGSIAFTAPGTPVYPADLVVIDPVVTLTVRSSAQIDALRLGYYATGASWEATYAVVLGRRNAARVSGAALINSGRLTVEEGEVQLLAGSVGGDVRFRRGREEGLAMAAAEASATEERVGDFHLYTLPGRITLKPGIATAVALFDPATAGYEKRYVVAGAVPMYGGLPQYGDEQAVPVEIRYTLTRERRTAFGDRPLPAGVVRLYEPDSAGRLQLVGQAGINHTPAGRDLTLGAGTAFDLTAARTQTAYSTARDTARRTVATADYSVKLSNATEQPVTVDVLEQRAGEWQVLSSSVPGEKLSSTTTRFRVTVPARGETELTYRVRVRW